jgi:hypothetical protein
MKRLSDETELRSDLISDYSLKLRCAPYARSQSLVGRESL